MQAGVSGKKIPERSEDDFFPGNPGLHALPPYLCVRVRLKEFRKNKDRIGKIAAQDQTKYFHSRACL